MKQKERERERGHFMLREKNTMLIQFISIRRQCWKAPLSCLALAGRKKKNENTALRTELYLLMPINGAEMEGVQDCWLADCHNWLFFTSKCSTHWYTHPAKTQAASFEESKLYRGTKHALVAQCRVMSLGASLILNCFSYPFCCCVSKQVCYLTN